MTTPIDQRIPACPKCRYSWEGLPPEGACPECGLRFNETSKEYRPRRPFPVFTLPLTIIGSLQPIVYTWSDVIHMGRSLSVSLLNNRMMFVPMLCGALAMVIEIHLARRFGPRAVILADGLYLRRFYFSSHFIPWRRFKSFVRPKFRLGHTVVYLNASGGQQLIEGVFDSNEAANEFVYLASIEVRRVHMMEPDSNHSGHPSCC